MEEDIKILEGIDVKFFISGHEASDYIIDRADRINAAIENLISAYKKLEEENKELQTKIDEAIKLCKKNSEDLWEAEGCAGYCEFIDEIGELLEERNK